MNTLLVTIIVIIIATLIYIAYAIKRVPPEARRREGLSEVERFLETQRRERYREGEPGYRKEGAHYVVGDERPLKPDFKVTAESALPGEKGYFEQRFGRD